MKVFYYLHPHCNSTIKISIDHCSLHLDFLAQHRLGNCSLLIHAPTTSSCMYLAQGMTWLSLLHLLFVGIIVGWEIIGWCMCLIIIITCCLPIDKESFTPCNRVLGPPCCDFCGLWAHHMHTCFCIISFYCDGGSNLRR